MSLLSHIIEKFCTKRTRWKEMQRGIKFNKQSVSRDNCQYFRFYFVLFSFAVVVMVVGVVELASHIKPPHAVSWRWTFFSSSAFIWKRFTQDEEKERKIRNDYTLITRKRFPRCKASGCFYCWTVQLIEFNGVSAHKFFAHSIDWFECCFNHWFFSSSCNPADGMRIGFYFCVMCFCYLKRWMR